MSSFLPNLRRAARPIEASPVPNNKMVIGSGTGCGGVGVGVMNGVGVVVGVVDGVGVIVGVCVIGIDGVGVGVLS